MEKRLGERVASAVMRAASFRAGAVDTAPILIGVVPFGVIAGVAAVGAGFSNLQAILSSSIIFAGASQLAAYDLIGRDAAMVVVIATVLIINSRMMMYSAALAPHFVGTTRRIKAAASYLLTDQAFATSIVRYGKTEKPLDLKLAYYFGSALALWST